MEKIVNTVLAHLGIDPVTVDVGVHFVGADEIRGLNKQHRGKDKVTDVLSFPMLHLVAGAVPTPGEHPYDVDPTTGRLGLGDVVVCEDETEVAQLVVHGVLHLLGYDHETDEDEETMNEVAGAILRKLA